MDGIPEKARLALGQIFQRRYEIVSLLGRGGMSIVYLAADLKLKGKKWAIKETAWRYEDYNTFVQEAEVLIRLNHPHLPHIVDYYGPDENGLSYLVMDYIAGQTLEQHFALVKQQIHYTRVVKYSIQLCHLFSYLHGQQPYPVIYRDLKPENIMIDEQDQVRLIDFGIARNYQSEKNNDTVRLGTIGFAAPEQFQAKQTDQRTDLYSLGAVMYYLLSGGVHHNSAQVPLTHFRSDIPNKLVAVIDKLLQSRPDHRFQSADEVLHELNSLQNAAAVISDQIQQSGNQSNTVPRYIVIGSLYPGAGSTFVGMALARALHRIGIAHAYIENPTNPPDLYALLFGDKNAPKNYRFISEQIAAREPVKLYGEWTSGLTCWYPVSPEGFAEQWNAEQSLMLLQSVKRPYVLYDISGQWKDEHVQEICRHADDVIVVTDTSPSKMYRPQARSIVQYLLNLRQSGKLVHLIANKDVALRDRKQWLKSQFITPICCFPAIDYEKVIEAQWEGKLVQDRSEVQEAIFQSLYPLLNKVVSDDSKAALRKYVEK